ncbi:hypothetical protein [Mucilaginibacter sp.]|uniref:hypothetical protein n=1 Tax=Mucilaginibacter sp. TaxID=1882438 RepID=UPI00284C37A1|nr:hypothetical protein [Mucilaginibacter sp.]MDR3696260.1 hypothetical protein [Mucilaginibacter sp.]
MRSTILIHVINPKAIGILRELEELRLINILKEDIPAKTRLSKKHKGVFSIEDAKSFNLHTQKMRKEWGEI